MSRPVIVSATSGEAFGVPASWAVPTTRTRGAGLRTGTLIRPVTPGRPVGTIAPLETIALRESALASLIIVTAATLLPTRAVLATRPVAPAPGETICATSMATVATTTETAPPVGVAPARTRGAATVLGRTAIIALPATAPGVLVAEALRAWAPITVVTVAIVSVAGLPVAVPRPVAALRPITV